MRDTGITNWKGEGGRRLLSLLLESKVGIYVKAEVQGILLSGADSISKTSKMRLARIHIKLRHKHITLPE